MREQVGIEIKLKEDLTARLKSWVPLFEQIQKHTKLLEQSQGLKKTNDQLDQMNRHIKNINGASAGLGQTSRHLQNMGGAAQSATRQVRGLELGLGAITKVLGPLMIAYKGLQMLAAGASEGLDFQSQQLALRAQGYSAAKVQELTQASLDLGSSGKYMMSGGEFMQSAAGMKVILGAAGVNKSALEEVGRFKTAAAMSKLNMDNPELITRFWELYARRTPGEREKFDQDFMQILQATKVPMNQILTQATMSGGALIGREPKAFLSDIAYGLKENTAAGAGGGGGGGRGRIGLMKRALETAEAGRGAAGVLQTWQKVMPQWFPNIAAYHTAKKGRRQPLVDVNGGIVMTGLTPEQAGTPGGIPGAQFKAWRNSPDYEKSPLAAAMSDNQVMYQMMMSGAATLGMGPKAAQGKTPQQLADWLHQQKDPRQKELLTRFANLPGNAMQDVLQHTVGRYVKSVGLIQQGVEEAPGMKILDSHRTPQQLFEQLVDQMKTFADKVFSDKGLIDHMTNVMQSLVSNMAILNDHAKVISDALNRLFGGPGQGASTPDAVNLNTKNGPVTLDFSAGNKIIEDQTQKDFWRIPKAINRAGHDVGRFWHHNFNSNVPINYAPNGKHELVVPPAPYVPQMSPSGQILFDKNGLPLAVPAPPSTGPSISSMSAQQAAAQRDIDMRNVFANASRGATHIHGDKTTKDMTIQLDGPATTKLLKGEAVKVNQAAQKKQAKSLNQMSQTGSKAGGSITTSAHNHGDSGD